MHGNIEVVALRLGPPESHKSDAVKCLTFRKGGTETCGVRGSTSNLFYLPDAEIAPLSTPEGER